MKMEDLDEKWPLPVQLVFTSSQLMELEVQIVIYTQFLRHNVSVPAHLLVPIRRTVASFSGSVLHSEIHKSYTVSVLAGEGVWVDFNHILDCSPRKCSRTDGRKWRCTNNAAGGANLCEKHMCKGRRSRKRVCRRIPADAYLPYDLEELSTTIGMRSSSVPIKRYEDAGCKKGFAGQVNTAMAMGNRGSESCLATTGTKGSNYIEDDNTSEEAIGGAY